jgi:hypothetical protein
MANQTQDQDRPDWVKQVQADAERLTKRRLEETREEQERNAGNEQALFAPHPAPAEQRITTEVKVAERSEAVTEKVPADSAVNAASVKELKQKA